MNLWDEGQRTAPAAQQALLQQRGVKLSSLIGGWTDGIGAWQAQYQSWTEQRGVLVKRCEDTKRYDSGELTYNAF